MKKILLVAIIGLLLSTAAFADHAQDSFALGGTFGIGVGINGLWAYPYFYPLSLSLHIPNVPIMWGLNMFFLNSFGIGISGDWYFYEPNLVSKTKTNDDGTYKVLIDWYLGVGGYLSMYMGAGYFGGNGGVRLPFGVSWHSMQQIKKLEVTAGMVVGLGIGGHHNNVIDPYVHWFFVPLEVAVRWWFE